MPPTKTQLTAYPKQEAPASRPVLVREMFQPRDASLQNRVRFGRSISLDRIEMALRQAHSGSMRDITDLSRETVDTDPHLAGVLGKRLRAVSGLPWVVQPADGAAVDTEKAAFYAAVVTAQLEGMSGFRRTLGRLAWALFDGRSAEELIWVEVPGGVGLQDPNFGPVTLAVMDTGWIHPRRLSFGPSRELRVVDDEASYLGQFTKQGLELSALPYKFLQWTPQLFGDYAEREGLAQRCLYWSFFKRFAARERMILSELFGKPWRWLEVEESSSAQPDDLASADEIVDALGASYTARLPRGVKLHIEKPDTGNGVLHAAIIAESDSQLSKLVLGQTGTTDGISSGLNSAQSEVMAGEQATILQQDALLLAEVIENQLTDAIIAVNFGASEVMHAPRFVFRTQGPTDYTKETARLKAALEAGLAVRRSEAYEIAGFSEPDDDDPVIRVEQPATPEGAVAPPVARPTVVWPVGTVPTPGSLQPAPTEESIVEPAPAAPAPAAPAPVVPEDEPTNPVGALDSVASLLSEADDRAVTLQMDDADCIICAGDHIQPSTTNGSVESLLDRSMVEARREVASVVRSYQTAVRGLLAPGPILAALFRAQTDMDLRPLGRSLERRMVQSAALGALDADILDDGAPVVPVPLPQAPVPQATLAVPPVADFSTMPFERAVRIFQSKKVMPRATFDKLSARAKQRAFTVANVVSDDALRVIQSELAAQIGLGGSLASFADKIGERMKTAGFLASPETTSTGATLLRASHVETVYRTNVLGAYNAGRAEQMRQPAVLARRPVWMIRSVQDGRTRDTHKAVNGVKLLASDPFWRTAYPPFGYNCRCRVISLGPGSMDDVVSGSTISGLPDADFSSGLGSLLEPDPF